MREGWLRDIQDRVPVGFGLFRVPLSSWIYSVVSTVQW